MPDQDAGVLFLLLDRRNAFRATQSARLSQGLGNDYYVWAGDCAAARGRDRPRAFIDDGPLRYPRNSPIQLARRLARATREFSVARRASVAVSYCLTDRVLRHISHRLEVRASCERLRALARHGAA